MTGVRDPSFAFVVMPFAAPFTAVYRQLVKPAVEACGIACIRADEESQGHIHSQMLERIFHAAVVVADISGLNANVFYELGVAHSSGCKTIVICDQADLNRVPFDIAPYRVFAYAHPDQSDPHRIVEAVEALVFEIKNVLSVAPAGIPNPVQDYLASQSPVRSSNSLFIPELSTQSEEELLSSALDEVVYYGITANSFSEVLTGLLESRQRPSPLTARLCLLDPKAQESWDFVYRMREERPLEPSIVKEYMEEDVITQRRSVRRLESLAQKMAGFSVKVHFFTNPPLFWAYLVDQERLIIGHLAMGRMSARNLPVSILVKGDRSTLELFNYYHTILEASFGRRNEQIEGN